MQALALIHGSPWIFNLTPVV
jgi:hypothetical protein